MSQVTIKTSFTRTFVAFKHAEIDQMHGKRPYICHVDEVVDVVNTFGYNYFPYAGFNLLVIDTCFMHDLIEDTKTTKEDLLEDFNPITVNAVVHCTDVDYGNRKKNKIESNIRFSKLNPEIVEERIALIAKPSDLYSNMKYALDIKAVRFVKLYVDEYKPLKAALYREGVCDVIWEELDKLYVKSINLLQKIKK